MRKLKHRGQGLTWIGGRARNSAQISWLLTQCMFHFPILLQDWWLGPLFIFCKDGTVEIQRGLKEWWGEGSKWIKWERNHLHKAWTMNYWLSKVRISPTIFLNILLSVTLCHFALLTHSPMLHHLSPWGMAWRGHLSFSPVSTRTPGADGSLAGTGS